MIWHKHASLLGSSMLAACLPAHADWSGKAEPGGSFASGNSDNEAANAAAVVKCVREQTTIGLLYESK